MVKKRHDLIGMREISQYLKRSEATTMDFIFHWDFPAKKDPEGVWVADRREVDLWWETPQGLAQKMEKAPKARRRRGSK